MNLLTLKQQLVDMLNRSDTTLAQAENFINMGVRKLERTLRLPFMERMSRYEASGTTSEYVIPWDYVELMGVFWKDRRLQRITSSEAGVFFENPDNGCDPRYFWREGNCYWVHPTPPQGSFVDIKYYAEFENFNGDTYETFELRIIPDLILYAALLYAADFYVDDRKTLWQQTFSETLSVIQGAAEKDEFMGSDLRMKSPFDGIEY